MQDTIVIKKRFIENAPMNLQLNGSKKLKYYGHG